MNIHLYKANKEKEHMNLERGSRRGKNDVNTVYT